MKVQIFIICCILQLINGKNNRMHMESYNFKDVGPAQYIVGSKDALPNHAPFQCSLQNDNGHYCGGAIISPKWVVTAAECLCGINPAEINIVVETNTKSNKTYYPVEKFIMHEKYNKPECAFNIGLIQVKDEIKFSEKVYEIELSPKEVPEGRQIEITGSGSLISHGTQTPTYLQMLKVKALHVETCKRLFPTLDFLHETHFCSVPKTGSACSGDEGSPVFVQEEDGPLLVGIVAFPACEFQGEPDGFTKISYFYSWINQKTGINR